MRGTRAFTAVFLAVLTLCAAAAGGGDVPGNGEGDAGLADLLQSLEADRDVRKRVAGTVKEKGPGKKAPAPSRRSPLDILREASRRMERVVKELRTPAPRRESVLEDQARVVELLDELLENVPVASPPPGGGGGTSPRVKGAVALPGSSSPAAGGGRGGTRGGGGSGSPGSVPPREAGTNEGRKWGFLPDRLREEILQLLQDEMNPMYRELLRLYYKNLDKE